MPSLTPGQPLPLGVPGRAHPSILHHKGAGLDLQSWLVTPEISPNYPAWKDGFICISSQAKARNPGTGAEIINSRLLEGSEPSASAQSKPEQLRAWCLQHLGHTNFCLGRNSLGTLNGATRTFSTFTTSPFQASSSAFPGFPTFSTRVHSLSHPSFSCVGTQWSFQNIFISGWFPN